MAKQEYPYKQESEMPKTIETIKEDELRTTAPRGGSPLGAVEIVPAEQAPLTPQDMPSGMVGSVVDSARAAASAAAEATEDSYIYNEDTKETRVVTTRAGYAPAPMPFGFRLATEDEIAAYKAAQKQA